MNASRVDPSIGVLRQSRGGREGGEIEMSRVVISGRESKRKPGDDKKKREKREEILIGWIFEKVLDGKFDANFLESFLAN